MKEQHYPIGAAGRSMKRKSNFRYALVGQGAVIGLITGLIISLFRLFLHLADSLRDRMVGFAHQGLLPAVLVALILLLIALAVAAILRFEPESTGSGIPQVEAELRGKKDMCWWKVILAKFAGCGIAIGGGLALGREGPSIQIGAMVGKGYAKCFHRMLTEERLLMSCGAGAGLAAAFGAPLAGAMFCLEELHKNFSLDVLVSTLSATVAADFVAANIMGLTPVFGFDIEHSLPLRYYWAVIVLGVILGFFGAFYNRTLAFMQDLFDRIAAAAEAAVSRFSNPSRRRISPKTGKLAFASGAGRRAKLIAAFAMAYVCYFAYPLTLGSGNSLVGEISAGRYALGALAVLLVVKFVFSTASFGSTAPGGIFLPLLVLGAITGGMFTRVLGALIGFDQKYIASFVVLAMAAYFAAIVQAPVTGVILITEMTGDFTSLLPMVLASLIAYIISELAGAEPIYTQLMNRSGDTRYPKAHERKSIVDEEVHYGSYMDGRMVMEMGLPIGALIVSVLRGEEEFIPDGHTILRGGDVIELLMRESDIADVEDVLQKRCKSVYVKDDAADDKGSRL